MLLPFRLAYIPGYIDSFYGIIFTEKIEYIQMTLLLDTVILDDII